MPTIAAAMPISVALYAQASGGVSGYQLAAPLGVSLAIAIRWARPQGCEGPRLDATIASDPVALSHFRRPIAQRRLNNRERHPTPRDP
jgi:hypothetical protein